MEALHFSGSFVICDLKLVRYRQLINFMKFNEYLRSRSFAGLIKAKTYAGPLLEGKTEFENDPGHMIKTSSPRATIAHLRVNKYSHWTK